MWRLWAKETEKPPKINMEHNWAELSDEQMSNGWPFSLLNDEQMSNWLGVEHQPDNNGALEDDFPFQIGDF